MAISMSSTFLLIALHYQLLLGYCSLTDRPGRFLTPLSPGGAAAWLVPREGWCLGPIATCMSAAILSARASPVARAVLALLGSCAMMGRRERFSMPLSSQRVSA